MVKKEGLMVDVTSLWQACGGLLKERVSKDVYDTWFQNVSLDNISDYEATLRVPNRFFRDWIRDHYHAVLEDIVGQVVEKQGLRVAYTLSGQEALEKEVIRETVERPVAASVTRGRRLSHLNPRYTFSSFVAAANNQLVRAACLK